MSLTRYLAIAGFMFVIMALAAVEIAARREDSKIPTIADMCGFVMRYRVGRLPVGRIAVYGFWWWVGFHFFAR